MPQKLGKTNQVGKGKISYRNGDSYEGDWLEQKKHGFGTIIFAKDNNVYSGFWKDDKRHGKLAKILILRQRKDGFD